MMTSFEHGRSPGTILMAWGKVQQPWTENMPGPLAVVICTDSEWLEEHRSRACEETEIERKSPGGRTNSSPKLNQALDEALLEEVTAQISMQLDGCSSHLRGICQMTREVLAKNILDWKLIGNPQVLVWFCSLWSLIGHFSTLVFIFSHASLRLILTHLTQIS